MLIWFIVTAIVALIVGAYSHKWLASVTGAPSSLPSTVAQAKADAAQIAKKV